MTEDRTWIELVSQARRGQENAMSLLAKRAGGRVRAYVYRVTLDPDLTEDLSQEVLLQMVKSLNDLQKAEHFWPWLYRISQSKIKQHYKAKQRRISLSDTVFYRNFVAHRSQKIQDDGLREAVHKELSKKVMMAMKRIKQQYRAVLALRCFDQLSYADIAVALDCSEVGARVLFFRAKQALKKQLSHQGLKKSVLLACLGLFGKLTAPTEAASSTITVSAATTEVGLTAAILGTAGSKLGVVMMTVIAAGLIGALSLRSEPPSIPFPPALQRSDVRNYHFTIQLLNPDPNTTPTSLNSKGAYEHWFYLPDGVDGPMLMRMQRWNPQQSEKLCSWLQDAEANYYFDSGNNLVHINNCRVCWSNLKVRRLPTDSKEFVDFLSLVEGEPRGFYEYTRDPNSGLMTNLVDYRFVNAPEFETEYIYNTFGEKQFEYNWATDIPIVDERDLMHRRGWTYFRISGKVGGHALSGRGCLPFFYNASKAHPPWMSLNVGNDLKIVDNQKGAYIHHSDGTTLTYPSGTFFKGFARPWMGLHAADIVRRDATEQGIWFKSERMDNKDYVRICLLYEGQDRMMDLIYALDMENDVIRDIRFKVQGEAKGFLTFSYLQDIDDIGNEFTEPIISADSKTPSRPSPGILWLVHLVQGLPLNDHK